MRGHTLTQVRAMQTVMATYTARQTQIETIARTARKRPITGIKYNYSEHTQPVAAQFSYDMRLVFPLRLGGPCVCMIVFNIELLCPCILYAWNGQMHAHVCEMSTCVHVQNSGFKRHCARPNWLQLYCLKSLISYLNSWPSRRLHRAYVWMRVACIHLQRRIVRNCTDVARVRLPLLLGAYTPNPAYAQEQIIISNDMHSINSIWSITKATTTTMTEKNSSGCNEYKANSVILSSISFRDRRSCHPFRNAMFAFYSSKFLFFSQCFNIIQIIQICVHTLLANSGWTENIQKIKKKEDMYHAWNGMT